MSHYRLTHVTKILGVLTLKVPRIAVAIQCRTDREKAFNNRIWKRDVVKSSGRPIDLQ